MVYNGSFSHRSLCHNHCWNRNKKTGGLALNRKIIQRSPIFLLIFLLSLIIFSPFIRTVNALSYYDFDKPATVPEDFIQNAYLNHQSGKLVHVVYDVTLEKFIVRVWNSDGTFYGTVERDSDNPSVLTGVNTRLKLIDIDADEFLVVELVTYSTSFYSRMTVVRYNVNTLAKTDDRGINLIQGISTIANNGFSGIDSAWYGGNLYIFFLKIYGFSSAGHYLEAYEYDPITPTLTYKEKIAPPTPTADSRPQGYLNVYQYTASSNVMFITVSTRPQSTTPLFYIYDADSNVFEFQAQYPVPTQYHNTSKFWWINAGYRISGNDIFIHFNWIDTYLDDATDNPVHRIIQHRLVYNTTVQASNLTAQNTRQFLNNPTVTDVFVLSEVWALGYIEDINSSIFNYYYPIQTYDWDLLEWVAEIWEVQVTIPDWFNYGIQSTSLEYNRVSDEEIYMYPWASGDNGVYDALWREFGKTFQSSEQYGNTDVRIWYGVAPLSATYDITWTITPDETPKIILTNYRVTFTSLMNDIGTALNYIVYLDGSNVGAGVTDGNGAETKIFNIGEEGTHTITVELYRSSMGVTTLLYTETYSDIWTVTGSESDLPTPEVIIPVTVAGITVLLPIFFIVLVPTFALGEMAGKIGILAGLVIGVTVGAMSGLLPMYTVFLMILVIVLAFVFLIRGGRF